MVFNLPLVKTKIAPYGTNNSDTKRSFMTPGEVKKFTCNVPI